MPSSAFSSVDFLKCIQSVPTTTIKIQNPSITLQIPSCHFLVNSSFYSLATTDLSRSVF